MSTEAQVFAQLAEQWGVILPDAQHWTRPEWKRNYKLAMDQLAMDAQPATVTVANVGIPALFTTMIDPDVIRVALAPLKGAEILGETKRGTWIDDTIVFPMVEMTGEVSSYGDWNNNGRAGLTAQWPQRQSYHFQVIIQYGEREIDRAGAAKLNWVNELQTSAANALNRYQDLTYHFGVAGLQNYGLLNDPGLPSALTPVTKAATGTKWISTTGVIMATANEVFADIQALYFNVVSQSMGLVEMDTPMTLAMSPRTEMALTITNSFNVSVRDLLQKNFPNLKIKGDQRYSTVSGELLQLIGDNFNGSDTGFCAFTEKMRQHPLIRDLSAFKQKTTSGTWGAVFRYPLAVAQMLGV